MTGSKTATTGGSDRTLLTSIPEKDVELSESVLLTRRQTSAVYRDEFISYGDQDVDSIRIFLKDSPASTHRYNSGTLVFPPAKRFQSSIRDLRPFQAWQANYVLDLLTFEIPSAALERWARNVGIKSFGGLRYENGARGHDEVFQGFAACVLPYMHDPATAPRLFIDYVLQAVCTYAARRFGIDRDPPVHSGGLAPWQERRAKEMIEAHLDAQISLKALAEECRLSVSHFTKTFRQTVGQTPHQWLMDRRIDRAQGLLLSGNLSLSTVAANCGFSDQSHFTRAFAKRVGASPGAWRRSRHAEARPARQFSCC